MCLPWWNCNSRCNYSWRGYKTSSEKCQFSSITECCIHNHWSPNSLMNFTSSQVFKCRWQGFLFLTKVLNPGSKVLSRLCSGNGLRSLCGIRICFLLAQTSGSMCRFVPIALLGRFIGLVLFLDSWIFCIQLCANDVAQFWGTWNAQIWHYTTSSPRVRLSRSVHFRKTLPWKPKLKFWQHAIETMMDHLFNRPERVCLPVVSIKKWPAELFARSPADSEATTACPEQDGCLFWRSLLNLSDTGN